MRILMLVSAAVLLGACASVPGLSLFSADEDPVPPPGDTEATGVMSPEDQAAPRPLRPDSWDGSQFGDVPLPREFHIVFDQSFTHGSATGLRIADLRYVGEARPEDAVRFFQEEMPSHGWEFQQLCGVESKMLTYSKDDEKLEVMVSEGGVGRTMVAIRLFPR